MKQLQTTFKITQGERQLSNTSSLLASSIRLATPGDFYKAKRIEHGKEKRSTRLFP